MYGDTEAMRRQVTRLREQGLDIRSLADRLVAQTEGIGWTGRAADAMRERVRDRATHLRDVAGRHETAADSLERHLLEVDTQQDLIADVERRATSIVEDARTRVARVDAYDDPDGLSGVRRTADPEDQKVAAFVAPPSGHQDWLSVTLPGL